MNKIGLHSGGHGRISPIPVTTPASPSGTASVAKEALSNFTNQPASPSKPIPAVRNLSPLMPETKEQAIKNRDGHLWECVDRIEVEEGFIYKFTLRQEYNTLEGKDIEVRGAAAAKKNREIKPAVEMVIEQLVDPFSWKWSTYQSEWDTDVPASGNMKTMFENGEVEVVTVPLGKSRKAHEVLKIMGYNMEITKNGIYLYLPDEVVLETRWNTMVDTQSEGKLLRVSILPSQGIATDQEFTKAFIDQKLILSTGNEFVHDHQAHLLAALGHMLESPENYSQLHDKFSEVVMRLIDQIKKAGDLILKKKRKFPPQNALEVEYYKWMEKNRVLADVIPAIVADIFAATSSSHDIGTMEAYASLSSWGFILGSYENFVDKRHKKQISEKYLQEHSVLAIPANELAEQMQGISLNWFFKECIKVLDEK